MPVKPGNPAMVVTGAVSGLGGLIVLLIIKAFAFKGIDLSPESVTAIEGIVIFLGGVLGHSIFKQNLAEDYAAFHVRFLDWLKKHPEASAPPPIPAAPVPPREQGQR